MSKNPQTFAIETLPRRVHDRLGALGPFGPSDIPDPAAQEAVSKIESTVLGTVISDEQLAQATRNPKYKNALDNVSRMALGVARGRNISPMTGGIAEIPGASVGDADLLSAQRTLILKAFERNGRYTDEEEKGPALVRERLLADPQVRLHEHTNAVASIEYSVANNYGATITEVNILHPVTQEVEEVRYIYQQAPREADYRAAMAAWRQPSA